MSNSLTFFLDCQGNLANAVAFKNGSVQGLSVIVRSGGALATVKAKGQFRWTSAVRSLTALLAYHKAAAFRSQANGQPLRLFGTRGSAVVSLDDALFKEPNWILDLFGVDSKGRALSKRLFNRVGLKFAEKNFTGLALRESFLAVQDIHFLVGERELTCADELLSFANSLLNTFSEVTTTVPPAEALYQSQLETLGLVA